MKLVSYLILLYLLSCSIREEKKKWIPPQSSIWKEIKVRLDSVVNTPIEIKTPKGYFIKNNNIEEFINKLSIDISFLSEGEKLKIVSYSNQFIYKNRAYRGNIELYKKLGIVYVINLVSLEDYLLSVVPSEMPASWHIEALKAQAIAARTYALYNVLYPKFEDYHLEADVSSQMYTGIQSEHFNSTKAVEETRGLVMTHKEDLVQAFYHSNSGGITEIPEVVWGVRLEYMKSVSSSYCTKAENLNWEYFLSNQVLLNKLGLEVEDIQVKEKSPSGRIKTLVVTTKSQELELDGQDFRMKIGSNKVKSLLFTITKNPTGYLLQGKGFGHGVGMSQWGSFLMAKDDKNFEEILKFYYSDIELEKLPD